MIISLIAILTTNHVIGRENSIPWYFTIDMHWFKYHTIGKPVIMGRKTFESLKKKPLLNRSNIVLSNTLQINKFSFDNIYFVHTPEQAIALAKKSNEIMIIGGGTIYNIFFSKCTRMYLTYIDCIYNYGDTWFPTYDQHEWKLLCNFYKLYKDNKKCYHNLYFKILERY